MLGGVHANEQCLGDLLKKAKQLDNSFEPFPLVAGNEKAYLGQI